MAKQAFEEFNAAIQEPHDRRERAVRAAIERRDPLTYIAEITAADKEFDAAIEPARRAYLRKVS